MKRIISLICAVCLVMNFTLSFALTAEEKADLISLIKENADLITNAELYVDYTAEDAFSDLTLTVQEDDEAKTIFTFNCKAKEDGPKYDTYVKVGNYYIKYFNEGEYCVYDKINGTVLSIEKAYENGVISDADLDYLYENCAYKYEDKQQVIATTDDEDLNAIIKEQVNPLFSSKHHGLDINDGTFADLEVYKFFDDKNITVFSFDSSNNEGIDGIFDWYLGNYYFFDYNTGDEIYVLDKAKNKLSFLDTAYENKLVTDEMLEEMANKYFLNRADKAAMRLADKLDTERKIYQTIKADAEVNPRYEDYKDLGFDDFTFNVHYKSGLAGGIYIFDFQTSIHAYTQAVEYEKIGDYVFTYWHGGKHLYAVYNANGEAKFGKLRELYENDEIGNDVLDDLFDRNNGISIHKVGDINCDNNIDIVDVVSARNMIVSGETFDFDQNHMIGTPSGFLADVNNDQCVDILDVVIMRNIIVNG